jgi:hypothetical protein
MLIKAANLQECQDHQKYVAVIFDEVHIRADLVYNKHTGELVGFCNFGDINNKRQSPKQQRNWAQVLRHIL